jgi:PAS domain S-box-containing protein
MNLESQIKRAPWFLLTVLLSCATILAVIFSLWELVEHRYFRDLDYATLHYLYLARGIAASLFIGLWAAWFVLRERRRHEEQLQRSHERYDAILSNTADSVVLFDEKLRVMEWNAAAERLYGFKRQQALGQVLPHLPSERAAELEDLLSRVKRDPTVIDLETQRSTAHGDQVPVAASYTIIRLRGKQSEFFLEVTRDLRPRLRLRDKSLQTEKLLLMDLLATAAAHHLNTPLRAMLLQIQTFRQKVEDWGDEGELASVEQHIRSCQEFVQKLLRFAHRPPLKKKPLALAEVIEAVTSLLQASLRPKNASLRTDLDGLRQCRILGDQNDLEVMFSALISNAIAAVPVGGSIYIHGGPRNHIEAQICIDNTGGEISEQLLLRVFEPFFTTKPTGRETGLGLAIARNIAYEHGGTLALRNAAEGGVRATVQLPLLAEEGAPSSQEQGESHG